METIINILTAAGFVPDGQTIGKSFKIVTEASYPLPGKVVTQRGRQRFVKGNWKATVGPRTVFFWLWLPDVGEGFNYKGATFYHARTKDPDAVRAFINDKISNEATAKET